MSTPDFPSVPKRSPPLRSAEMIPEVLLILCLTGHGKPPGLLVSAVLCPVSVCEMGISGS
ncbi:hypothetical protein F2P79_017494 [Pimephales promelas]|nr:hypothetical protein F2P79_017494 [Pimephales promelas]